MELRRIARHLLATPLAVRRAFPPAALSAIERALSEAEARHGGELRFAVEAALDLRALLGGQTARERAIDVFGELRVWDTEQNNGVLIYLLLADRDVEIVADRGINSRVDDADWQLICAAMERDFAHRRFAEGVINGIESIAAHLAAHYPAPDRNELPDSPVVL